MKLQRLPYDEKVKLLESLGRIYRREKTRELIGDSHEVHERTATYVQKGIGHMIEHVMENCTADTICIIKHDFLDQSPRNWYCNYYAKSSYYRLKKEAVEEFVRCLDI